VRHPSSRSIGYALDRELRHLRDAGVSASDPRLRRRSESCRQAGRAAGGRGPQSFRNAGDAGEPLWAPRPRRAGADGVGAELNANGMFLYVMPALVASIDALLLCRAKGVDGWNKSGHDERANCWNGYAASAPGLPALRIEVRTSSA